MAFCNPDDIISGVCGAGATSGVATSGLADLALLSGAALAVSAVILAFIYMWGSMFRNSQLSTYVKQELYELVVSAILVIFIIGSVAAMSDLKVGGFIPPNLIPSDPKINPDTTIYAASARYYERVGEDMSGWLQMNYAVNMYVDQIASVTPYARPNGVGLVASPMAGLASPIKQLLYNMSVAVSVAYIINQAQLVVYIFALQAFLKYYLPIGIFFRCFTPTRKLGGTLIGIAAAFLFVLPALTTLSFSIFYNAEAGPLLNFGNMLSQYFGDAGGFAGIFRNFYETNFKDIGKGVLDLIAGAFGGLGRMFQSLIGKIFLLMLFFPISVISVAFTIGFVMPAFNIIIFTAAAKSISKSFGEEIDISSLTRMV